MIHLSIKKYKNCLVQAILLFLPKSHNQTLCDCDHLSVMRPHLDDNAEVTERSSPPAICSDQYIIRGDYDQSTFVKDLE